MKERTLAGAWNGRGLADFAKVEHNRAIHEYDEALRLAPNDPVATVARGLAHQANGNLDAAVADFRAALRLDPSHAKRNGESLRAAESAKARRGR